jgi:hypothetical protein
MRWFDPFGGLVRVKSALDNIPIDSPVCANMSEMRLAVEFQSTLSGPFGVVFATILPSTMLCLSPSRFLFSSMPSSASRLVLDMLLPSRGSQQFLYFPFVAPTVALALAPAPAPAPAPGVRLGVGVVAFGSAGHRVTTKSAGDGNGASRMSVLMTWLRFFSLSSARISD